MRIVYQIKEKTYAIQGDVFIVTETDVTVDGTKYTFGSQSPALAAEIRRQLRREQGEPSSLLTAEVMGACLYPLPAVALSGSNHHQMAELISTHAELCQVKLSEFRALSELTAELKRVYKSRGQLILRPILDVNADWKPAEFVYVVRTGQ